MPALATHPTIAKAIKDFLDLIAASRSANTTCAAPWPSSPTPNHLSIVEAQHAAPVPHYSIVYNPSTHP